MPNLLFVAPCDRVIIDQNGSISLITIIEEAKFQLVSGTVVPLDSPNVPIQWNVVCFWEQSTAYDNGRTFEQRTALTSESGETLTEAHATWIFEKSRHRTINVMFGMPIKTPGPHRIRIFVREKADTPKEWKEVASYPMLIELTPAEEHQRIG